MNCCKCRRALTTVGFLRLLFLSQCAKISHGLGGQRALSARSEVVLLAKTQASCRRSSLFGSHTEMIADEFTSCRVALEQIYRFCNKF